ncbi:hypothetical protein FT641_27295 [Bacillus paranthracis]|uniref:hypothetical protein n=1 Tax=Bacillus paranthracis TaxID=2026186 RepID=UPI001879570B|nr:hypothetical protein [Bacillus paranthracis]MBE7117281.1 hypothetical protein [Bacillus paranthracis]MBE7134895.1 hypothetical protein [Bacillus paranthracis]MBE7156383.1 hypothetical protein [Bacillus paranthracis]
MSKTTTINNLAMAYQNETCDSLRQVYMSDLLEELKPWIARQANQQAWATANGDARDFESIIYETIWKALNGQMYSGKAIDRYDLSKGNFIGYLKNLLKSPLGNQRRYLNQECRSVKNEGFSLDDVNQEGDDMEANGASFADTSKKNIDDVVCSDVAVFNLIDEFAANVANGVKKAQALKLAMYPEKYDNDDVAKALGFESYTGSARKALQRVRESFIKFAASRNFSLVTN